MIITKLCYKLWQIDLQRLERCLKCINRRRWIRLSQLNDATENGSTTFWLGSILAACEVLIARGCDKQIVLPVLEILGDESCRRIDYVYSYHEARIDLQLRALALLAHLNDREFAMDDYFVWPSAEEKALSAKRIKEIYK